MITQNICPQILSIKYNITAHIYLYISGGECILGIHHVNIFMGKCKFLHVCVCIKESICQNHLLFPLSTSIKKTPITLHYSFHRLKEKIRILIKFQQTHKNINIHFLFIKKKTEKV